MSLFLLFTLKRIELLINTETDDYEYIERQVSSVYVRSRLMIFSLTLIKVCYCVFYIGVDIIVIYTDDSEFGFRIQVICKLVLAAAVVPSNLYIAYLYCYFQSMGMRMIKQFQLAEISSSNWMAKLSIRILTLVCLVQVLEASFFFI